MRELQGNVVCPPLGTSGWHPAASRTCRIGGIWSMLYFAATATSKSNEVAVAIVSSTL